MKSARDALALNRVEAMDLAKRVGTTRTRALLEDADRDLTKRLRQAVRGPGKQSFTYEQLRTTLVQVRAVLKGLKGGMKNTIVGSAEEVSEHAAGHVIDYLGEAQHAFGLGRQPLALKEAAVMDAAREGARASVLRRLASSGEPVENADEEPHPAKIGILDRYDMNTIGVFEETLQRGLIGRKSLDEMKSDLIEQSPFLQKAPASWAERIVRTEVMGAYNRAGFEATREADEQLGDVVKILSATFDDRTGADSFAVHGQVRRTDEAFQSWFGLYQHPPNRANDREIVVPHRLAWPFPPYLRWKTDGEIAARWRMEGHKGPVPARPKMTTVPLNLFGKEQEPRAKKQPPEEVVEKPPVEATQPPEERPAAVRAPKASRAQVVAPTVPWGDLPQDPPLPLEDKHVPGTATLNRYTSRGGEVQATDLFMGKVSKADAHLKTAALFDEEVLLRRADIAGAQYVSRDNVNLPKSAARLDRKVIVAALEKEAIAPQGSVAPVLYRHKGKLYLRAEDAAQAFAREMSPNYDGGRYRIVDLDMHEAGLASTTPAGLADVVSNGMRKKNGAVVREGLRSYLKTVLGLGESQDVVPGQRPDRFITGTKRHMEDAAGTHGWSGAITIRTDVHKRAIQVLGAHIPSSDINTINAYKYDPVRVLLHEELHGFSGNQLTAYVHEGVAIEEAQTEVLARKATRDFLGIPSGTHVDGQGKPAVPFALPGKEDAYRGHGSYGTYIRTVIADTATATGLSWDEAAARMERSFGDVVRSKEKFETGGAQIRAYVKHLYLGDPALEEVVIETMTANLRRVQLESEESKPVRRRRR